MLRYTDKFGRIHDAPSDGIDPSSDNGWLYSAVAKKIGYAILIHEESAIYCCENLQRHPPQVTNRPYVPMSRDEILGLAYLGFLQPYDLQGWNFSPDPLPRFNLFTFIVQLISLVESFFPFKLKHRTTFWKEEKDQIYRFAYSVPLQDRDFLNVCFGRKRNPFYRLIAYLDSKKKATDRSARQIRFLKYGKDIEAVSNYYGPNHPLTKFLQK